jgi:hypothetical protein
MDSMQASVVWIDGGELYAFEQVANPGMPRLCELPLSETQARNRVAEVRETQNQITSAISVQRGEDRAMRLKPYVSSDILPARQSAISELGRIGPSALSVISSMLDEPAFADESSGLIGALVEAGGETAGTELNRRSLRELAFWKSTGPSLRHGWFDADKSIHAPLRERYEQTYQLIVALERTHHSPALYTATALRDLWRSLPQLNDPSGLNQMAEECDKLIRSLKSH